MDYSSLTPISRMALKIVDAIRERLINNECDEEELVNGLNKLNFETSKEYIRPKDYVNADEAMKMLGIGYNRSKFFALTKKYGIVNYTINNQHIGFRKKDIEDLANIINTLI